MMKRLFLLIAFLFALSVSGRAATINIQSASVPNWQSSAAPVLYVFYNETFTAADGTVVAAGSPNNLNVYKKVTCTLLSGTVTIPAFTILSTRDGIDNKNARVSFYFYTTSGAKISAFGTYVDLAIPSTIASTSGCSPVGTCATFSDLKIYNTGSPGLPPDEFYTKTQVDGKLVGLTSGMLADPGSNGLLARTALGVVAARSIAVGSNLSVSNADGVAGNPTVSLGANVVTGVTNETNIQGSVAGNNLTFIWAGTLAKARTLATTVYTDQANTWGAFVQTFQVGANHLLVDPTDTTKKFQFDASNIGTGTTRTVNIPNANSTTIQSDTGAANNFLTAVSPQGVISKAQPAFSNLSGAATLAQLPFGTANQLHKTNVGGTAIENATLSVGTSGTDFAVAFGAGSIALNLPDASATARGAMTTGTQTIAGAKTFTSTLTAPIRDSGGQVYNAKSATNCASCQLLGDGSTNDTTALQNLVNFVLTSGGGTIFFPNGVYVLNGALQAGSNAVIQLPTRNLTNAGIGIAFVGAAPPPIITWTGSVATGGVVLKSTTVGSGTRPAIFGVDVSGGAGSFNNYTVEFENITFRTTDNPTLGAINAFWVERLNLRNVSVDPGVVLPSNPTTGGATAIHMPTQGNDINQLVDNVAISGYRFGLQFSEHCNFRNLYFIRCVTGLVANSTTGFHVNTGNMIFMQCQEPFLVNGTNYFNFTVTIEDDVASGDWWDAVAGHHVYDPSALAKGVLHYRAATSGTGAALSLSFTGLNNVFIRDLSTGYAGTGTTTVAIFKDLGGATSNLYLDAATSQNTNYVLLANALPKWYLGNDASNDRFRMLASTANGNPEVFTLIQTASALSGFKITPAAAAGTVALTVHAPAQASTTTAGFPVSLAASDAVAGSSVDGAAAGGMTTIGSGAAARRNSGNADGGLIKLAPGAGIGTGNAGQVQASWNVNEAHWFEVSNPNSGAASLSRLLLTSDTSHLYLTTFSSNFGAGLANVTSFAAGHQLNIIAGADSANKKIQLFTDGGTTPALAISTTGITNLQGGSAVASAATITATGNVFHVTGTTTITSVSGTNINAGTVITIIFDGILTFTDGSNLKLAGNFVTTADDTITLVYDGTNWYEVARAVN